MVQFSITELIGRCQWTISNIKDFQVWSLFFFWNPDAILYE